MPSRWCTTDTVRSGFFDYGISWLLTRNAPRGNPGSASGHSARLAFRAASDDGTTLEVSADAAIEPLSAGDAAVNGLKTRHALHDGDTLTVPVDPTRGSRGSAWIACSSSTKMVTDV